MASTPITRFYGLNPPRPFLYTMKKKVTVYELNQIYAATEEDVKNGLCEGTYQYIHHDTFFRRVVPVAASSLSPKHYFCITNDASIDEVLPAVIGRENVLSFKTSTLTLVVSQEIRKKAVHIIKNISSVNLAECKEVFQNCFPLDGTKMPELASTDALSQYQEQYFGDEFLVSSNECLLGKDFPFCISATSQPDICVYHKRKYVHKETVKCSALIDHSYATEHITITGDSSEHEKKGECQCISGQIHLAATLGLKVISNKQFFTKAKVYGNVLRIEGDVRPYRLDMDFITGNITVLRSETCIHPAQYLQAIKVLLASE